MHSQQLSTSEERSEAVALHELRELSLIGLAANLDDPLCRRELSIIFANSNSPIIALARKVKAAESFLVTLSRASLVNLISKENSAWKL